MQDLVAHLSSGGPTQSVPQVRINEVLLALVRAKVVIKGPVKVRWWSRGATLPVLPSADKWKNWSVWLS